MNHVVLRRILARPMPQRRSSISWLYQRSVGLLSKESKQERPTPLRVKKEEQRPAEIPNITELSVAELTHNKYHDLKSLTTFVDQLLRLPSATTEEHRNAIVEILTQKHGQQGSRLAQRLVQQQQEQEHHETTRHQEPTTTNPQQQQHRPPLVTTDRQQPLTTDRYQQQQHPPMTEISKAIASAEYQNDIHVFDIPNEEYADCDIYKLEHFVCQVEDTTPISEYQLHEHILPLSRATALKHHQLRGAQLTERILLAVQRQLPVPENLYNRSMIAWGNVTKSATMHDTDVKRIWSYMMQDEHVTILPRHYKSLIRGIAPANPEEAYHILRHQLEPAAGVPKLLGETTMLPEQKQLDIPELAIYNLVAMAFAKEPFSFQHMDKPMRVLEIMQRVKRLNQVTHQHEWDGHSFVALFLAHRKLLQIPKSNTLEVTQWLEQILAEVQEQLLRNDQETLRKRATGRKRQLRRLDGNDFPERDLDTVLFPLSMSWAYEIMIDAYLKSGQTVKAVQMVMDMLHGTHGVFKCIPRNSTLVMLAPKLNPEQRNVLFENCILNKKYERSHFLNMAMEDWASLTAPQPAYVAKLVEAMLVRSFATFDDKRNKPTGRTFRIAMKAWTRCDDEFLRLSHLDSLMMQMKFLASKDVWYTVKEVHVRMWMTAYLNLCRSGQRYTASGVNLYPAEHCERILKHIRSLGFRRLNIIASFVAMSIRAWAMQEGADIDELDRLERVDALFKTLQADDGIPTYPANWVLSTCCRDYTDIKAQQRAYQIASSIFIRKDVKLNSRSYEIMLEIVYKIRQDEVLVMELFRRACLAGVISQDMVIRVAEIVTTAEDLRKLFHLDYSFAQMMVNHKEDLRKGEPPHALLLHNLPLEWSAKRDRKQKNEQLHHSSRREEDDDESSSLHDPSYDDNLAPSF